MKARKLYLGLIVTAVIAAITVTAQTSAPTDETARQAGGRAEITGVWLVNLNIGAGDAAATTQTSPPSSGAKVQAPFTAIETFHFDGTFIETSLTDYLPPQGPPGQGIWERTGNREFALTIYGVMVGDVTKPQFQGTYKVRSKLTLNHAGSEFSGPFTIEIYDPAGNLVTTLEGTAQGRRARADPLQ